PVRTRDEIARRNPGAPRRQHFGRTRDWPGQEALSVEHSQRRGDCIDARRARGVRSAGLDEPWKVVRLTKSSVPYASLLPLAGEGGRRPDEGGVSESESS